MDIQYYCFFYCIIFCFDTVKVVLVIHLFVGVNCVKVWILYCFVCIRYVFAYRLYTHCRMVINVKCVNSLLAQFLNTISVF